MNVISQVDLTFLSLTICMMCSIIASGDMITQNATQLLTLKPLPSNSTAQDSSISCLGSCMHAGVCTGVNISTLIPGYVRRRGLDGFQGKFGDCQDNLCLVLHTHLHQDIEIWVFKSQ